ncbi:MAG: carbohydrate porin, partial [Bradyrhizobiaceae bacterium]|nr:carbohydrate porin [Bradyrhizobiaceae bacterium]
MPGRSVRTTRLCGLVVVSSLLSTAAYAADLSTKATPLPSYPDGSFWTSPYLLGDFGRAKLAARGIDLSLTMVDEAVANASGGRKHNSAQAGQFAFQAKFDMAKLAGIHGGLIGVTYVDRFGQNENTTAQIPALMLTNEVFGRG